MNWSKIPNNILKFNFRFPELEWTEDQQQFRDHGHWTMLTLEPQWHGNTGTSTINSNTFTMNNYALVSFINLETGILFGQNQRLITTAMKSSTKSSINVKAM